MVNKQYRVMEDMKERIPVLNEMVSSHSCSIELLENRVNHELHNFYPKRQDRLSSFTLSDRKDKVCVQTHVVPPP